VALFNLDHYPEYRQRNEQLFGMFQTGLAGIPGLVVRMPKGVSESNYQNLICLIDEAAFGLRRDDLWRILRAENILAGRGFYPPMHQSFSTDDSSTNSLPHTEHYCARTIELPMNQALTEGDAARLIELLGSIQHEANVIGHRLAEAV